MKKSAMLIGLVAASAAGVASAAEGPVPKGIPHLEHVFVIMMENHGYAQVIGNPLMPFVNAYAKDRNLATNYFAVAHPSFTNYLEVTGGSNFGVLNDNPPDWHSTACQSNLVTGIASNESDSAPTCPIAGIGTDAATPAIDYTNETTGTPGMPSTGDWNIDGTKSIAASKNIVAKTVADQLVAAGRGWKSYQEDLPAAGADRVNVADGLWSNLSNLSAVTIPGIAPTVVGLYAVKHDPFAYFKSVQEGDAVGSASGAERGTDEHGDDERGDEGLDVHVGLGNIVPFDGVHGLFADLATGRVPAYSFIAPNQCHDQHGRSNAGPFCAYDPNDVGTVAGLNPALMAQGDSEVKALVRAIHQSPVWKDGHTAIVVVWDENDYSVGIVNKVAAIVDTNYGSGKHQSQRYYTHFSLLKSIEAGFGLPCLNHACDNDVEVMADLFD